MDWRRYCEISPVHPGDFAWRYCERMHPGVDTPPSGCSSPAPKSSSTARGVVATFSSSSPAPPAMSQSTPPLNPARTHSGVACIEQRLRGCSAGDMYTFGERFSAPLKGVPALKAASASFKDVRIVNVSAVSVTCRGVTSETSDTSPCDWHPMDEFTVERKLGSGGQGATYSCIRKQDKRRLVVKQVLCSNIAEANYALKGGKAMQKQKVLCSNIAEANYALKEGKAMQKLEHAGV
ncbi:hypothetical protein T484DRAFT_1828288, partial [Baffinella frigidus]